MKKPTTLKYSEFAAIDEKKKEKQKFSYGCAMLHFKFPDIKEFHGSIDEEDIYTEEGDRSYGLEKETHVTLLYGLHSDEIEDEKVKDICTEQEFGTLVLHNLSAFENEKFDVLKFDVKGKGLKPCNKKLTKLPHTTEHPVYHPHATVAYLKPGKAKKYIKEFKDTEYEVTPDTLVYSKPEGKKLRWPAKIEKDESK
jgi:2'-5' RNA ligase